MNNQNAYNPKEKLEIVIKSFKSNEPDNKFAKLHGIHPETLSEWKEKLIVEGESVFEGKKTQEGPAEPEREDEYWKDIPNYEDRYQVSNYGRIRSKKRKVTTSEGFTQERGGDIRSLSKNEKGYLRVTLQGDGPPKTFYVHRIVAEVFMSKSDDLHVVHHKDGDPSNNRVQNLEWVSRQENTNKAVNKGEYETGEKHHRSQLTEEDVVDIRRLYYTTDFTQKELADKFGVTRSNISSIVTGRTWSKVARDDGYPTGSNRESGTKLTEKDVLRIRREVESGSSSCEDLADDLDVTVQTVKNVVRGDTWSHVEA